jgi:hypothetical protein
VGDIMDLIAEIIFGILELLDCLGPVCCEIGKMEANPESRKRIKIFIHILLVILIAVLITISLVYRKGIFSIVSVSYLCYVSLSYYLIFFFREIMYRPRVIPYVLWPLRILKCAFAIALIVMANLLLTNPYAKGLLIGGASVALFFYVCIDIHRIARFFQE